jgi:flagellin-like hook-associated protein FlgL
MSLAINTNVEAFDAHRNLQATSGSLAQSMQRLSSGLRINSAADDAAGLAISQKLTAQINGLSQAGRNTQDGISLVQTAEGSLNEVQSMLQRIRELAVQYQNGTLSTSDRSAINSEVSQLTSEIQRTGTTSQFNNISLLNSTQTITFQVGANDGEVISVLRGRPEPLAARVQQPADLPGEPDRVEQPHQGRRHGIRDDELHEGTDSPAGRHVDARAGQPGASGRPETPAVSGSAHQSLVRWHATGRAQTAPSRDRNDRAGSFGCPPVVCSSVLGAKVVKFAHATVDDRAV